jgi:hypothetical protein
MNFRHARRVPPRENSQQALPIWTPGHGALSLSLLIDGMQYDLPACPTWIEMTRRDSAASGAIINYQEPQSAHAVSLDEQHDADRSPHIDETHLHALSMCFKGYGAARKTFSNFIYTTGYHGRSTRIPSRALFYSSRANLLLPPRHLTELLSPARPAATVVKSHCACRSTQH